MIPSFGLRDEREELGVTVLKSRHTLGHRKREEVTFKKALTVTQCVREKLH